MLTHILLAVVGSLADAGPTADPVLAGGEGVEPYVQGSAITAPDREILSDEGFERHHPDLRWRRFGAAARAQQRPQEARKYFRRAAHYADKPSQAMLAEMYWTGEGGDTDRALAYAWMDLAAERGAPLFLAHRERYWNALTAGERERAVREGRRLYAEYGDEAAKPRLEKLLWRGRTHVTGSRVGWVDPNLKIYYPGDIAPRFVGKRYYADRYWKPEAYWRWQNEIWRAPDPEGQVNVGRLRSAQPDDAEAGTPRR